MWTPLLVVALCFLCVPSPITSPPAAEAARGGEREKGDFVLTRTSLFFHLFSFVAAIKFFRYLLWVSHNTPAIDCPFVFLVLRVAVLFFV